MCFSLAHSWRKAGFLRPAGPNSQSSVQIHSVEDAFNAIDQLFSWTLIMDEFLDICDGMMSKRSIWRHEKQYEVKGLSDCLVIYPVPVQKLLALSSLLMTCKWSYLWLLPLSQTMAQTKAECRNPLDHNRCSGHSIYLIFPIFLSLHYRSVEDS